MKQVFRPIEAVIAVTLKCNARCVMCNIWKNKPIGEVKPEFYRKLPSSLKEINITGGEPFLRSDLPEIISVIKKTCPQARLLINTNGYLINQIKKMLPHIIKTDPNIALRVSLDGFGHIHDHVRGLPNFYEKAIQTLDFCRNSNVKDLGVSYTLMEQNKNQLIQMYKFCQKRHLEFSLTVATDSPIYFGTGKIILRPKADNDLKSILFTLVNYQYRSHYAKEWVRAWFNERLWKFINTGIRYFPCQAGKDFFYLDSFGKVYTCHLQPWLLGDLNELALSQIFSSSLAKKTNERVKRCQNCWMVCTARSVIKKHFFQLFSEILLGKFTAHFKQV